MIIFSHIEKSFSFVTRLCICKQNSHAASSPSVRAGKVCFWKWWNFKLVFNVSRMFVSNLFSCFLLPRRKFRFKYCPDAAIKFRKSCDQPKRTIRFIKSTRNLRPKKSVKTVQRSSAIKIKIKLRRRKSRNYYEQMGLYDLATGEFELFLYNCAFVVNVSSIDEQKSH